MYILKAKKFDEFFQIFIQKLSYNA